MCLCEYLYDPWEGVVFLSMAIKVGLKKKKGFGCNKEQKTFTSQRFAIWEAQI